MAVESQQADGVVNPDDIARAADKRGHALAAFGQGGGIGISSHLQKYPKNANYNSGNIPLLVSKVYYNLTAEIPVFREFQHPRS
jgi:hypothetical protein